MRVVPPLTGHLDMALSNYMKDVRQAELIADILFPRVPVLRQTDTYWIAGKEVLQRTEQTLRAPGTPAAETRFTRSRDNYFADSHALKSTIPDEDRLSYGIGDLTQDAVDLNTAKIAHDREYRAMQKATNPANFASSNTVALSGTAQWDNTASDPLSIGKKARTVIAKGVAVRPNTLALGFDVAEALRVHPQLLQRFQYTSVTGQLNDQQLAQIFNVQQVVVGGSVTGDPAGIAPNTFDWSNFALFFYTTAIVGAAGVLTIGQEGQTGAKQISFGKSFTWTGAPGTVDGYGVITGRHPDITAKADIVGVDWYSDEKITGADAGFLVTNVLATPGGN